MLIVGLMSGTSADGIDAALVDITGSGRRLRARLIHFHCVPHDTAIREAILRLCDPLAGRIPELCALNSILGIRFAAAARSVTESRGVTLADVRAIASHGQTVWHQPDNLTIGGTAGRGTLQIGCPAVIAAETGCAVISDFRSADMAAGGQGAPLVPFADWALLRSGRESRAVQNVGGIANVTYLPRGAGLDRILAFDTGPGNMVIDAVVNMLSSGERKFDRGGEWAAKGFVNTNLLTRLLDNPFFRQPPPKSTGREQFGESYARGVYRTAQRSGISDSDLIATLTALTAETIAESYRKWIDPLGGVQTVIVGGGGALNHTLMRMIGDRLSPARITTHEEFGISSDAKEAIAFAILGYETLHRRPSNVPGATGASYPAVLGSVTPAPRRRALSVEC